MNAMDLVDNSERFMKLAFYGCLKKLKASISEGLVDRHSNAAIVALNDAVKNRHIRCVKALVEWGVDVNATDRWSGDAAMHAAVRGVDVGIIEYLIGRGADPLAAGSYGMLPFHYVAEHGNLKSLEAFLAHGVDVAAKNGSFLVSNHWQAIHYAAYNGHLDCLKLLIRHGADPDARDASDQSPLQIAAKGRHLNVVDFLVKAYGHADTVNDLKSWAKKTNDKVQDFIGCYAEQFQLDSLVTETDWKEQVLF